MGYLRIKANECEYKEKDKDYIMYNGISINDDDIMTEII